MKTFFRAMAGFLLCAMLFTFTLWRNDAFPDLSGITAFVQDTAGRLDTLQQIGSGQEGIAGLRPTDDAAQFPEYTLSEELDPDLETYLCNAFANFESEITIDASKYTWNEEILQAVVSEIRFTHPELFFVGKNFSYQSQGGIIQKLRPTYTCTKEEAAAMTVEYEAMIDEIVAGVPTDGSDFDKLLYLHDYFVLHYSYDHTGLENEKNNREPRAIRDAYSFLKEKTGVCQAYMLAFIAVTAEVGIESIPVTSSRMNHAWNMVKLDGAWYHVDVTWDDTASYPSYTSYSYFLQSDAGIIAIDEDRINETATVPDWHCDWAATQKAADVKYDSAVWRKTHSPMIKSSEVYYCAVSEGDTGERNVFGAVYSGVDPAALTRDFAVSGLWRLKGSAEYYVACYTGLAVYGNELIYNTNNTLRAHDLITGEDRLIAFLEIDGSESIFGLCGISSGGVVSCLIATQAGGEEYRIISYQL
ncbi:MAG: transglutaminase domain-containing protein [Clostridia bacterium]|nr:transglutaminase domain-containing protein [Clostridia bacterium]